MSTKHLEEEKLLHEEDLDASFLPESKSVEKKAEKLLKKNVSSKKIYKKNQSLFKRSQKKSHTVLKLGTCAVAVCLLGYFLSNQIRTDIYNNQPPKINPHTPGNVLDPNGNDFDVGKDGQIVLDDMKEDEKQALSQTFAHLVLNDANSRLNSFGESGQKIETLKSIPSISLVPNNLEEGQNEFDKYFLSILLDDGKEIYALNYLTGKDFESTAQTSRDFFVDFIDYLNSECAIDSCSKMSEEAKEVQNMLNENSEEKVLFVAEPFLGYLETGLEHYFVPTYFNAGQGKIFYTSADKIDSWELNPMQELANSLSGKQGEIEVEFGTQSFPTSQSLQKASQILHEQLQIETDSQENNTENKEAPSRRVSPERTR